MKQIEIDYPLFRTGVIVEVASKWAGISGKYAITDSTIVEQSIAVTRSSDGRTRRDTTAIDINLVLELEHTKEMPMWRIDITTDLVIVRLGPNGNAYSLTSFMQRYSEIEIALVRALWVDSET